ALDVAVDTFALEGKDAESPLAVTLKAAHNGRAVSASGRLGSLKNLAEANARFPVRLAVETAGFKAEVEGHVVEPRAPKEFDFKARIKGDNVAAIAAILQPAQAAKVPAIGPLEAAFRVKGKGRAYAIEDIKASAGQSDFAGAARVSLAGRVPEISAALRSRRLDLKELAPAAPKAPAAPPADGRVFPADPLPLGALRIANADVGYKAEALVLPGGVTVREVDAKAALKDGRLALPFELIAAGGRVKGEATLDGSRAPAQIAFRLDGSNVDWGRLLADTGMTEMVWDSKAETAINLRGSGNSARALMAGLEGDVKVVLGPGRIGNKYLDLAGADAFTQIATALNPFAKSDEFTALSCAVARFKVAGGVAETRDGIALETGKMTVVGGGRVDLRSETLDLAFKPEARQGLGVGLGNVIGLVRIGGTLANPTYNLDPLAVVTGTVGAVTGGLSSFARSLFEERKTATVSPCQAALGVRPQPQAQPPRTETRPPPPERKDEGLGGAVRGLGEDIGKSLKGIFGR
ncbi:MAG: AsmA family protein, partial [Rhodospirillales bacterium]|nr:AsmA family protein [Rhodospirillales bacterium]